MQKLITFWKKLAYFGMDRNRDRFRKETVLLNRFAINQFLFILIYIPFEVASFGWGMIPSVFGYGILSLLCLLFNK